MQISHKGFVLISILLLVVRNMLGRRLYNTGIVRLVASDGLKFAAAECLEDRCDVADIRHLDHLHQPSINTDLVEIRDFGRVDISIALAEDGTNHAVARLIELLGQVDTGFSTQQDWHQYTREEHHVACRQHGNFIGSLSIEEGRGVAFKVGEHLNGCIWFLIHEYIVPYFKL